MKTSIQPPLRADWTDPVIMRAIDIIVEALVAEMRERRAAQQKQEASDECER